MSLWCETHCCHDKAGLVGSDKSYFDSADMSSIFHFCSHLLLYGVYVTVLTVNGCAIVIFSILQIALFKLIGLYYDIKAV